MDCIYDVRPDESGFVLKWLLDGNPVYQWIPPKRPQAIAFFKTRADPNVEMDGDSLGRYRSLNIIRPEFNMTGEYTCSVQTFQSSDKRSAKLQIIGEGEMRRQLFRNFSLNTQFPFFLLLRTRSS